MSNWREQGSSGRQRAQQRQRAAESASQNAPTNEGKRKDWRKKGDRNRQGTANDDRDWTHIEVDRTKGKRIRNRLVVGLMVAILVGLTSFFVYLLFRTKDHTTLVTFHLNPQPIVNGSNTVSHGSASALLAAGNHNEALRILEGDPNDLTGKGDLSQLLSGVRGGGPNRNVVMMSISAVGIVGDDDRPYLFPDRVSPDDKSQWIDVQSMLNRIADACEENNLRPVVFLDCASNESAIQPRLMVNRFPSAVADLFSGEDSLANRSMTLIVSHAEGQQSWFSPELGRSVFSDCLAKGLSGAADSRIGNDDGKISLAELYEFIHDEVDDFVAQNRDSHQNPVVLGDGPESSIDLIYCQTAKEASIEPDSAIADVSDRMGQIQQRWDEYAAEEANIQLIRRIRPIELSHLKALLVQMEILAPYEADKEFEWVRAQFDTLKKSLFEIPLELVIPTDRTPGDYQTGMINRYVSIAEAEYAGRLPTRNLTDATREVPNLDAWIAAHEFEDPEKRPEEIDKLRINLIADQYCKREELYWMMWEWLKSIENGPTRAQLDEALELIDSHYSNSANQVTLPEQEWAEIYFLRMLQKYIDWESVEGDEAEVQAMLRSAILSRDASETYLASFDRRAQFWLCRDELASSDLRAIEDDRRRAEDLIYLNRFDEARTILDEIPQRYADAQQVATQLVELLDLREQALHDVAYLVAWEFRRVATGEIPPNDQAIDALISIREEADRLTESIYLSIRGGNVNFVQDFDSTRLRSLLTAARRRFFDACDSVSRSGDNTPADLIKIRNLLLCPVGDGEHHHTVRAELRKQYEATLQQVYDVMDADRGASDDDATPTLDLAEYDNLLKKLENTFAIDFTQSIQQVDDDIESLTDSIDRHYWEDDPSETTTQLENLKRSWIDLSRTRYERDELVMRLFGMDHIARRASPFVASDLMTREASSIRQGPDAEISLMLDRTFQENDNLELARRMALDFWGNSARSRELGRVRRPYFDSAAEVLLGRNPNLASIQRDSIDSFVSGLRGVAGRIGGSWVTPGTDRVEYQPESGRRVEHHFDIHLSSMLPDGQMSFSILRNRRRFPVHELLNDQEEPDVRQFPIDLSEFVTGEDPDENDLMTSIDYAIPITEDMTESTVDQLMLFGILAFRGHEASNQFRMIKTISPEDPENIIFTFEPRHSNVSTVNVRGGANAISDIAIILDCSISMQELIDDPSPDAEGVTVERTRMDVTRDIIREFLFALRDNGNYRVSLIAFGHRAYPRPTRTNLRYLDDDEVQARQQHIQQQEGWEFDWNDRDWSATDIEGWIGNGVTYYRDAEVVFPLSGSSTADDDDRYFDLIESLPQYNAWGQTPLYYAISVAAEHLNARENRLEGAEKHIIVFTDGVNFPGGGDRGRYDFDQLAEGVILGAEVDGLGYREITDFDLNTELNGLYIHPVLFDIDVGALDVDNRQKLEEIRKLGLPQGIEAIEESNPNRIREGIDQFTRRFFAVTQRNEMVDAGENLMGATWNQPIDQPGEYDVTLSFDEDYREPCYLYGGENISIVLGPGNRTQFQAVDRISANGIESITLDDVQHSVGIIGQHNLENRSFSFLLRRNNFGSEHTDRPGFAMLDIQARGPVRNGLESYRLVDFNYQSGRPCPILTFPEVPVDTRATYDVTIHFVPRRGSTEPVFGAEPSQFEYDRLIEELDSEFASETFGGVQMEAKNDTNPASGEHRVTVVMTAGSPESLQEFVVICPSSSYIRRSITPDGKTATYVFTVSPGGVDSEPARLQVFRATNMFDPDQGAASATFTVMGTR